MKKLLIAVPLILSACLPAHAELYEKGSFMYKKVIKNGKIIAQTHSAKELTQWIKLDGEVYHCVFNVTQPDESDELLSNCRD